MNEPMNEKRKKKKLTFVSSGNTSLGQVSYQVTRRVTQTHANDGTNFEFVSPVGCSGSCFLFSFHATCALEPDRHKSSG